MCRTSGGPAAVSRVFRCWIRQASTFWDPEADHACFDAIRSCLKPGIPVIEIDANINDPVFADRATQAFLELNELAGVTADGSRLEGASVDRKFVKTEKPDWKSKLVSAAARGQLLIGAGAGTGLSAKCAEAGGADLIIIYNSGRFRMAGRGSLAGLMPYGDANAIVVDMAREVLPVVRHTPVLAGVCGTDPFRLMDSFLARAPEMGFAGVQNFPTVGLIDGMFRLNLEETGMGFSAEIEMIARAHELGLLTCPYVFDEEQAREMARCGSRSAGRSCGVDDQGFDRRKECHDNARSRGFRAAHHRGRKERAQ